MLARMSLCLAVLQQAVSATNTLTEVASWTTLDIQAEGQSTSSNEAVVPASIDLWGDRIFFAIPRLKPSAVPTLVYLKLESGNLTNSSELIPYPSLEMNNHTGTLKSWPPRLVSASRVRADACDRLWVLDTGVVDATPLSPPKLLLFDLKTDKLLFAYSFKEKKDFNEKSLFPSITVDVTSAECDKAYAYIPDTNNYNLVVYSLLANDTHVVTHNYFHFDPLSGDFSSGENAWQCQSGIYGLSLSLIDREGFRVIFFHALASTMEFTVNSKYLQNTSLVSEYHMAFKVVGTRGIRGQSFTSFLDEETGVLFYTLANRHAVGCWNSFKGEEYNAAKSLGEVARDDQTLAFPIDLRVDKTGFLWVLVSPLPLYQYKSVDRGYSVLATAADSANSRRIRLLKAQVRQIIKGTVCDEM